MNTPNTCNSHGFWDIDKNTSREDTENMIRNFAESYFSVLINTSEGVIGIETTKKDILFVLERMGFVVDSDSQDIEMENISGFITGLDIEEMQSNLNLNTALSGLFLSLHKLSPDESISFVSGAGGGLIFHNNEESFTNKDMLNDEEFKEWLKSQCVESLQKIQSLHIKGKTQKDIYKHVNAIASNLRNLVRGE